MLCVVRGGAPRSRPPDSALRLTQEVALLRAPIGRNRPDKDRPTPWTLGIMHISISVVLLRGTPTLGEALALRVAISTN